MLCCSITNALAPDSSINTPHGCQAEISTLKSSCIRADLNTLGRVYEIVFLCKLGKYRHFFLLRNGFVLNRTLWPTMPLIYNLASILDVLLPQNILLLMNGDMVV